MANLEQDVHTEVHKMSTRGPQGGPQVKACGLHNNSQEGWNGGDICMPLQCVFLCVCVRAFPEPADI